MSTLMLVGLCLVVLGIGGRLAVGHGDSVRKQSATRSGGPAPSPSKGKKRAANTGTGVGIIAIIASLLFGGGTGLGFGSGTGVGTGGQAVESTVSEGEESTVVTFEEATKNAQDSNTIVIRVNKTDIYVNDYKCADADEFGKAMEEVYEDGMNITVMDDYADNEAYSSVTSYLKDNAYEYLVDAK